MVEDEWKSGAQQIDRVEPKWRECAGWGNGGVGDPPPWRTLAERLLGATTTATCNSLPMCISVKQSAASDVIDALLCMSCTYSTRCYTLV